MSDIDSEDVEERAMLNEVQYDRTELAAELRGALDRDEPISGLTKGLMANHLALLEASGLDEREANDD